MRCNHCGTPDATPCLVNFNRTDRTELTLCDGCVQDFKRDDSVTNIHTPAI